MAQQDGVMVIAILSSNSPGGATTRFGSPIFSSSGSGLLPPTGAAQTKQKRHQVWAFITLIIEK